MEPPSRILLIEPDPAVARLLGEALRVVRPGHLESVLTLAEGLKRSRQGKYQLVFVSAVSVNPGMGGVEEVRRSFTAPVIFTLPHSRLAGPLALEAWEWVAAPFAPADVARVSSFVLRLHAQGVREHQLKKRLRDEEALADLGRTASRAGADFQKVLAELDEGLQALLVHSCEAQAETLLRLEQSVRRGERIAAQLHAAGAPRPSEASTGRVQIHARKPTALVVDDDESIRELASCVIRQMGWNVVTARDGEEAFLRFQTDPGHFSVVVLDLSLPRLSGVEVIAGIRSLRPVMPVVLITGHGEESLANNPDLGLSGLLHKPFSPDALRAMLYRTVSAEGAAMAAAETRV